MTAVKQIEASAQNEILKNLKTAQTSIESFKVQQAFKDFSQNFP